MCARATDNRIWCWGANNAGQSNGTAGPVIVTPLEKTNNGAFGADIATGSEHTCTMQTYTGQNNAAICFGLNSSMQAPATMVLDSPIDAVYAGGNFSCARLQVGAPQCWGSNSDSQLGTGTASTASRGTADVVAGLNDSVIDLSLGKSHACASLQSGEIRCWGDNDFGQLAQGEGSAHHTAIAVPFINIAPVIPQVPDVVDTVESPQQQPVIDNPQDELLVVDTKGSEVLPQVAVAPVVKPLISRLKIIRGRSVSSKRLSRAVSLSIPKKSQGKMRISIIKGAKNCRFVGTSIRAVRRGTCTVSLTLLPKKGKKITRQTVISIR